jgi:thiol-disulfide isomerase/thioredoxin
MTASTDDTPHGRFPRRRTLIAAVALVGAVAGLAAVYGMGALTGNKAEAACRPATDTAKRLTPLAHGEVAAVAVPTAPHRLPALAFRDAGGAERRLTEWQGRTVLFNLWATWCVPCRKEMPALDQLQAKLGGPAFEVIAVNIDTRDPDKPKAWLKDVGISRLAYYGDPSAKVFQDLKAAGKAFGMPTTLLVDPAGCELANLAGPAEWASEDAVRLVEAALGREKNL